MEHLPKKLLGRDIVYQQPTVTDKQIAFGSLLHYRRAPNSCGPSVRLVGGPHDGYHGTVDAILSHYPRPRAVIVADRFTYHYEQGVDGAYRFLLRIKRGME